MTPSCLLIIMATCLTYSAKYLKTLRELAKSTSNFPLFALETSMRSKIITLGIMKNYQNRPYRGSKGGQNIFYLINILLTHARQQQQFGNPNSLMNVTTANLKTVQLVNNTIGKDQCLQCATVNCRLIINESADWKVEISNKNINLCALTETWFKEDGTTTPLELCPPGYKSISIPCHNQMGGRVAIIYKDTLNLTQNCMYSFQSMECSGFRLDLPSHYVNLAFIYKPPDRSFQQFLDELYDYMERNINTTGKLLLTGDFNIKMNMSKTKKQQNSWTPLRALDCKPCTFQNSLPR